MGPDQRAGHFGPDIYARWRDSSLGDITEALEHRVILTMSGTLANKSVLDVGCGDGTLPRVFARHGAAHLAGCDLDTRMVDRARAEALREGIAIDLSVASALALPYPDASFDVVTCITVLAFIPDAGSAIREMARVLRPGGRLVVGDLGKWSIWAARRRIRGWFGARFWRGARFRTAGELSGLVRDAGLTVAAVEGAIFFPPWTPLARLMAPLDRRLGQMTTLGAAFVAVLGTKP